MAVRTDEEGVEQTIQRALRLLAGLFIAAAVVVPLFRAWYPYDLESAEGDVLEQSRHSWLIYGRPSLTHSNFIYAPLHNWLLVALRTVAGGGYWPGRLLSLGATIAVIVAIFRLVRHETGDGTAARAAAGLYAATIRLTAGWFDLVRVDSLALGLLLAGVVAARRASTRHEAQRAALLFVLACLARQNVALVAAAAIAGTWPRDRKLATTMAVTFAALGAAVFGALQLATHGWFWYFVFTLPTHNPNVAAQRLGFWTSDLLAPLPFALLIGVLGVWQLTRKQPRTAGAFYAPVLATMIVTSWLARMHSGGFLNVVMPAYAAIAIAFGIGLGTRHAWKASSLIPAAALLLAIAQLAMLFYNPRQLLPTSADRAAARQTIAAIRAIPGDVWVPDYPDYARRAGKRTYAQYLAIAEVIRGDHGQAGQRLRAEIERAIRTHRFAAIVISDPQVFVILPRDFKNYYGRARPLLRLNAVWNETPQACATCGVYLPR